ncbi:MAG: DNA-binding protein [Hymenobacteraceae bacterium]|nr:DNA-binding protein [Hymenobacteraceae bacterium]
MSHLQFVVIVPAAEWAAWTARIVQLEAREVAAVATAEAADPLLTSSEAAAFLGLKDGRSVTKAKRAGRLSGVFINEKEYGFRQSELTRYLNRYKRRKP